MKIKIHPAAECVRMMDPDELSSLAVSIETLGQKEPATIGRVNGEETEYLVDGRNRWKACEMVGVDLITEVRIFESHDAVKDFIATKNDRRNITKGQKAMAIALLYPEPEKGGRGHKKKVPETGGFSRQRLGDARRVLTFSLDIAHAVRDGTKTLDDALKEIEESRKAMLSAEAQLASLRAEAPDLADLVTDEKLSMAEASAALAKRRAQQREQRLTIIRVISQAIGAVNAFDNADFCKAAFEALDDDEGRAELARHLGNEPIDLKKLDTACDSFLNFMLARFKP